jgi:hypothetical protein
MIQRNLHIIETTLVKACARGGKKLDEDVQKVRILDGY